MNVMGIALWMPSRDEFEEWKKFTNSDHESYQSFLNFVEEAKVKFGKITPLEMSVKDFSQKLDEFGLKNTAEGRSACSAMILHQLHKGQLS